MNSTKTTKLKSVSALWAPSSKEAFTLLLLSFVNTILQFINFTLLSKYLSVEGFGYYRTFLSITSFSGLFHAGYADGIAIKWIIDKKEPTSSDLFTLLAINSITSLALLFQLTTVTNAYVLGIFLIMSNLLVFIWNMFIRINIFFLQAACLFATQVLLMSYFFVARQSINVNSIILFTLVCNAGFVIVLFFIVWRNRMLKPLEAKSFAAHIAEAKKDILIGFPILLMGIFFLSIFNLDKVILPKFYDKTDFGYYAFASAIIGVVITILLSPLNLLFNKMAARTEEMRAIFHHQIFILLSAVCACMLVSIPLWFSAIQKFMPKYTGSFVHTVGYSFCVFPVLVLQLLTNNMYRVKKITHRFLWLCLLFLAVMAAFYFISHRYITKLEYMPFYIAQLLLVFLLVNELMLLKINNFVKRGLVGRIAIIAILNAALAVTYFKFKSA